MRSPCALSPQEARVLSLSASGLIDKEIGGSMGLSVATVRTYWKRIHAKLGTANHTTAVLEGARRGAILVRGLVPEAAHV